MPTDTAKFLLEEGVEGGAGGSAASATTERGREQPVVDVPTARQRCPTHRRDAPGTADPCQPQPDLRHTRSRRGARSRPTPHVALVQELDLLLGDLAAVVRVVVRRAVEVEVLRVDRLAVDDLVLLGRQVLHPVAELRAGP